MAPPDPNTALCMQSKNREWETYRTYRERENLLMHLVAKARLRKAPNDFNWSLLASIREGHWGENKVVIPADRSEKVRDREKERRMD